MKKRISMDLSNKWCQRNVDPATTTFHLGQQNPVQHFGKNESADTLTSTSQIASPICTVTFAKRVKRDAAMFKSRCSRTAVSYRFYTTHALLLRKLRFLRLANGSSMVQRYPARRSRSVREPSGKTSGKLSCTTSAQFPGDCWEILNALPPNVRADNRRDNSQVGAQRSRSVRVAVRTADNGTYRETTRSTTYRSFVIPLFNHASQ